MRWIIILGCLLSVISPAEAYDAKKIQAFCRKQFPGDAAKAKGCVAGETAAAKNIEKLRKSNPKEPLKGAITYCLQQFPESYSMDQICILEAIKAANGNATVADIPNFDTAAYCSDVSQKVGGSYQIEATCRNEELKARQAIVFAMIPKEIMRYCGGVAQTIGGSYQVLATCAEQEIKAKATLQ